MKTNKHQEDIKKIVLSCKHSENAVKRAVESYIAEQDRHYGEFSVGDLTVSIVLNKHYDENTGNIIKDNWQTTVTVSVVDNNVEVSFN